MTEYRPNVDVPEEQFDVPVGTYCPERINTKPLPSIPNAFSYLAHKATSGVGTDSLTGNLEIIRVLFINNFIILHLKSLKSQDK